MIKKPIPKPLLTSANLPPSTNLPNTSNITPSPANSYLFKQNSPQPPEHEPLPSPIPKTHRRKKRNRLVGNQKPLKKGPAAFQLNLQDVEDIDTSYQDDLYPLDSNSPLKQLACTFIKATMKAKQASLPQTHKILPARGTLNCPPLTHENSSLKLQGAL
jgi:hypothetical protein